MYPPVVFVADDYLENVLDRHRRHGLDRVVVKFRSRRDRRRDDDRGGILDQRAIGRNHERRALDRRDAREIAATEIQRRTNSDSTSWKWFADCYGRAAIAMAYDFQRQEMEINMVKKVFAAVVLTLAVGSGFAQNVCPCIPISRVWVVTACETWNCAQSAMILANGDPYVVSVPTGGSQFKWLSRDAWWLARLRCHPRIHLLSIRFRMCPMQRAATA